jgi:hypothetical protein
MADDVLFLLPVVIDDTSEAGARVPDKFVSVQWLRAPSGEATPALEALLKRLLAGEHAAAPIPRPPLASRPSSHSAARPAPAGPPPMPPFPHHAPGSGHWPKHVAEVLWWCVTAVWTIFSRFPRFIRLMVGVWLLITLFGLCRNTTSVRKPAKPDAPPATANAPGKAPDDVNQVLRSAATEAAAAIKEATKNGKGVPDFSKIGEQMAKRYGPALDANVAGKKLVLARFGADTDDSTASRFAQAVFARCSDQLLTARPADAGVIKDTDANINIAGLLSQGQRLGAGYMFGGYLIPDGEKRILAVRLIRVSDAKVVWSGDYPTETADPAATATQIVTAVLAEVPPRKP